MGPEAQLALSRGCDQRTPPVWDGTSKPYRLYISELKNWLDFTTIEEKQRAPAAIARLTGEPQRIALNIPRDSRIYPQGVDILINKLKEVYSRTQEQDLYHHFKELRSFRRHPSQPIGEFIGGFQSRADMISVCDPSVKLSPKLLAMMLIEHANLTHDQETALFGACGGRLDLIPVTRALKLVMEKEKVENSGEVTFATEGKRTERKKKYCSSCHRKGHWLSECWKEHPELRPANPKKQVKTRQWHFQTQAQAKFGINPLIDSAAFSSLIGQDTLKHYMEALRSRYAGMKGIPSELQALEPCHPAHLFGRHEKCTKVFSLCESPFL